MPDSTETTETTGTKGDATSTETATTGAESTGTTEGAESLGDAGKKALDAMKAKWKTAEATAKEQAAELAALKAKVEGTEAEHQAAEEKQRVKDEALAVANTRILKAEVRAAAAGKLNDPADALLHLNLSDFEVGADGEVDASLIATAIDDLIKNKPYLAAQGKRFEGSADGGARNESAGTGQLTRADLARMSPAEVDKATREGRFADVMAGKS